MRGVIDPLAQDQFLIGAGFQQLQRGVAFDKGGEFGKAREEIGLTVDVRVLGPLSPLYIPVSNFALHPVVAVSDERPRLTPALGEVERILEVSLDELRHPDHLRQGWRWRQDQVIRVPYFELQGERVWGATAMVLGELLTVLDANPSAVASRT